MSALAMFRMARKALGLPPGTEYPNLEALMEAEEGKPHSDFRVLSWVMPAVLGMVAVGSTVPFFLGKGNIFILGPVLMSILAVASWFIFDMLDKRIPASKVKVRALCEDLSHRYGGFQSIVGLDPALHPQVGQILDEAAGIYLKHASKADPKIAPSKALIALEESMGQILELGKPQGARAQEAELAGGWASSLLQEMRELDQVLDRQALTQSGRAELQIMKLREARMEIQGIESAMAELEQQS
ncbi:MAG TPA: hypothetical protein VG944_16525 [Fimbriimonas sp.]|nr:hypothetical protein [Fimbriimonas sp.]